MTIELRVLTGARAGHRARFDRPVVTIGRHPQCDFQLDVQEDLDVSSRHAELRLTEDAVLVEDLGSRNGTYVNGARVQRYRLSDGDVVQLGMDGPRVEVRLGTATGVAVAPAAPRSAIGDGRRDIGAPDVRRPSHAARRYRVPALVITLLVGVIAAAYALGARKSATENAELRRLVAAHDSITRTLAAQLDGLSDSGVIHSVASGNDSLHTAVQAGTVADAAEARVAVTERHVRAEAITTLDMPAINTRNAPAVAYLASELDGRVLAGTAFAIDANGRLLTNRHLVRTPGGATATRLAVKFRGSREWRLARLVRVAEGEYDDLALLQLDDARDVPAVRGIARAATALEEGAPVVTIGYPLAGGPLMDGDDEFIARTSLYPGTVSKLLPEVLQLAAFAGHGSSGSPVFDASGVVVGVVWGGPAESAGKLVYAVPAERVAAFLDGR